jgi:hypothetical protein
MENIRYPKINPSESEIAQWYGVDYGLDDRWFESWQGLGIFLFTTVPRPALGPTKLPIQWVPEAPFSEDKAAGA